MIVLAACGKAEAVPQPPVQPPATWHELGELATAVADAAKAEGASVDGAAAWGEPAMGCYAAWLALHGAAAAPDTIAQQLLGGLPFDPHLVGIAVSEVVRPAAGADRGTLSLAFERAPYRGRLRAQLASDGAISALACFWNDREPLACSEGCTKLIGSMP
ncbi:MAG: hypothetical protein ACM31C_14805 [Acidobacteriota bacterium]